MMLILPQAQLERAFGYTMAVVGSAGEEGRMGSAVLSCVHFDLHHGGNGFAVKSQKSGKWKGI